MKSYPIQFNRLPYYEHLQIAHLFDTMHIGKNVTETLLRREISMAWGTTTDSLTPEINPFHYAIEIKCLTLRIRPRTLF